MLEELEMADTREQEAAAAFWGQILFIFASLDSSTNEDIEQISSQWFLNFFFQGYIVNGETCKAERWGSGSKASSRCLTLEDIMGQLNFCFTVYKLWSDYI